MKRDAIIVLCHHLDDLTREHKKRLETGILLMRSGMADYIIVHGNNTKNYVIKQGISKEKILTCSRPIDTIEEAFFIKKEILLPKKLRKLIIVSSDYHIRYRVPLIFDFILGKGFDIKYLEVKSGKLYDATLLKKQMKSLLYAIKLFDKGDIESYIRRDKSENREYN